jgi:rhomboid family GlyGly-CTERM serine protease
MATQNQIALGQRGPLITITMVASAVVVFLIPALHALLVYDRSAVFGGQLWRLATGPWVHFSISHFFYDTLVLGMAGWMIERRAYSNFGWLCAITPVVTGLVMLALEPRLEICGGLSGLATAAVVFLALSGLRESGAWRRICWMALIATTTKIVLETTTGRFAFLPDGNPSFVPVPSIHIMGALTALAVYLWNKALIVKESPRHAEGLRVPVQQWHRTEPRMAPSTPTESQPPIDRD